MPVRCVPRRGALAAGALVVSLLAVAVRIPSCFESLWVDELHSAWAVWGSLSEVAPRAAKGNQAPLYYWMLWAWRQLAGSSELALRMPSVLGWAAACAMVVVAACRSSRRLWVGVLGGVLLAVEAHSIFFGTEARAYAAVALAVLVTAIALIAALEHGSRAARLALPLAAALAPLLHYTAGLTIGVLLLAGFVTAFFRHRRGEASGLTSIDLVAVLAAQAVAFGIAAPHLLALWDNRGMWARFAQPSGGFEMLTLWPWLPLVVLPLGVLLGGRAFEAARGERGHAAHATTTTTGQWPVWPLLLAVVVATTAVAWALSASGLLALWHRRYLVGLLPLLCWASADLWHCASIRFGERFWRPTSAAASVAGIAVLLVAQGTAGQILRGDVRLVHRGERWREAVAWMHEAGQPEAQQTVYCAAMLIESHQLNARVRQPGASEGSIPLEQYLCFPLASIYHASPCVPLGTAIEEWPERMAKKHPEAPDAPPAIAATSDAPRPRVRWLVARLGPQAARQVERWLFAEPRFAESDWRREQFGGVAVWRVQIAN